MSASRPWRSDHGQFLYAVEFDKGVVKVGRTSQPRRRMRMLQLQAPKLGLRVVRHHLQPEKSVDHGWVAESYLVAWCNAVGQPLPGRREFFTGLSFDAACALCDRAAHWKAPRRRVRQQSVRAVAMP